MGFSLTLLTDLRWGISKADWNDCKGYMNSMLNIDLFALEQEVNLLFDVLDNLSDWGCVVEGVGFLNRALELLLKSFLIEEATVKYLLDPGRALGDCANRAAAAFHMGLLPKTLYYNLQKICQIHNFFLASEQSTVDFTNERVRELVNGLVLPQARNMGSTKLLNQYAQLWRRKFIFIIVMASHDIIATALDTEQRSSLPEAW